MKTTLVYFASGPYDDKYQEIPVDAIYLVDYDYKRWFRGHKIKKIGKVTCLGLDALEAVDYLKKENVKIDYFVGICEGLYEGGGKYPINGDLFVGYVMPILNDTYIHITGRNYYHQGWWGKHGKNRIRVLLDLPYKKEKIKLNTKHWIMKTFFPTGLPDDGKILKMVKKRVEYKININPKLDITVIQDSIWNDYDLLDKLVFQYRQQFYEEFFFPYNTKVTTFEQNLDDLFQYYERERSGNATNRFENFVNSMEKCLIDKTNIIGFTPWRISNYKKVFEYLRNYKYDFPKKINFYHLRDRSYFQNLKDYSDLVNKNGIIEATYISNYNILIKFSDKKEKIIDFKPLIIQKIENDYEKKKYFEAILKIDNFKLFTVSSYQIKWIDIMQIDRPFEQRRLLVLFSAEFLYSL